MTLSVNIQYLGKCNSCCKQSHGKLGEGSACMSTTQLCIHSFTVVQLTSCFAFPTFMWISSMGVSGTTPFCMCGKIQKLQIHDINPLGDLPVNNTWVYGLFSFVIDHPLCLQLFSHLMGRGVNLLAWEPPAWQHLTCVWCSEPGRERLLQWFPAPGSCDWGFKEVAGFLYLPKILVPSRFWQW